MNPKTLTGMFAAAVVLTAAALTLDRSRATRAAWSKADDPLFSRLEGATQDVARLRIESSDGVTTVERRDGEWVVAERGGYVGRADEVARLVSSLAHAKRLEPKTKDPEKYEKLGLAGFEDEDSPTVRLTVEDADGDVLADLFVGNRSYRGAGESWYVRRPDEEGTWSADAKLRTPKRTGEWLVTDLMDVGRDRIASVSVTHAEGPTVELVRPDAEASAFDITNLPAGRAPKSDRSGAAFLGSLSALRLDDVKPAGEADFPEPAPSTTTWRTFDGLVVTAELAEIGEGEDAELLCRLSASLDETRLPGAEMGPELPEGAEETAPDEANPFALLEPEAKTREEIEAERAELAERFEGWVFLLPSWKKTSFLIEMEELLEPLPEPDPEVETDPDLEDPESEEGTAEGDAAGDGDEGDVAPPPAKSGEEGEGGER